MTPGDRANFDARNRTTDAVIRDLAARVGRLEGLRGFPPIRVDTTPAGNVISLIEDTAGDLPDPDPSFYTWNGTTALAPNATTTVGTFTLSDAGLWLISGTIVNFFSTNAPAVGNLLDELIFQFQVTAGLMDQLNAAPWVGVGNAPSGAAPITFYSIANPPFYFRVPVGDAPVSGNLTIGRNSNFNSPFASVSFQPFFSSLVALKLRD